MSVQRHPYAGHPAAAVLACHEVARWSRFGTLAHCTCGTAIDCSEAGGEHAAHLAEVLDQAWLLAPPGALPADAVAAWLNPADVEARLHAPATADDPDRLRARRDELEAALTDATPPPGPDPRRVTLSPMEDT